jgi:hypothetical protein
MSTRRMVGTFPGSVKFSGGEGEAAKPVYEPGLVVTPFRGICGSKVDFHRQPVSAPLDDRLVCGINNLLDILSIFRDECISFSRGAANPYYVAWFGDNGNNYSGN